MINKYNKVLKSSWSGPLLQICILMTNHDLLNLKKKKNKRVKETLEMMCQVCVGMQREYMEYHVHFMSLGHSLFGCVFGAEMEINQSSVPKSCSFRLHLSH